MYLYIYIFLSLSPPSNLKYFGQQILMLHPYRFILFLSRVRKKQKSFQKLSKSHF